MHQSLLKDGRREAAVERPCAGRAQQLLVRVMGCLPPSAATAAAAAQHPSPFFVCYPCSWDLHWVGRLAKESTPAGATVSSNPARCAGTARNPAFVTGLWEDLSQPLHLDLAWRGRGPSPALPRLPGVRLCPLTEGPREIIQESCVGSCLGV
ncbi:unnamed protein product [Symbiodinium natans]|uniref:Uncharacterized protein n=1 Tax=Symbiodinium natans TaxID=878477 RepID=A0A812LZG1_9DINO|nr:unnamed protein product [Symbiodinium natans]